MKIRALSVEVYRFPLWDCTNGGISSRFRELLIACPDGNEEIDTDVMIPLNFCAVVRRDLGFTEVCTVYPATVNEDGEIVKRPGWWMYGGNIADTSDSRWRALSGGYYPLHIHDRREF